MTSNFPVLNGHDHRISGPAIGRLESLKNHIHPSKPGSKNGGQVKLPTTYPSQALHFLRSLPPETVNLPEQKSRKARPGQPKLQIIVVGAGLGGLAGAIALARKGHSVSVLEQASKLGEVGAGIQIPPNSGRLLQRWGVQEHLQEWAVRLEAMNMRRWEDGRIIGYTDLGKSFQGHYEVPYNVIHRAHFHEAMYRRAIELGVRIELNKKVVQYKEEQGEVVLGDGSILQADLIVAADGIKSHARTIIQPSVDQDPQFNGFAAYRATVDVSKMANDPSISWILEKPNINLWIGENRHVMTYQMAAGAKFNMVLSHIDHSDPSTWTERYDKDDVLAEFSGWDPQLTKILSLIDPCMKWPLKVGKHLESWTSPSSKLVIIGDAAHAMLPYMSQGAAMAVEDAAALAVALNQITCKSELPFALSVFEKERIKRSGDMLNASSINGVIWHFPDGPEQRARDAAMEAEVSGSPFLSSANQWSDPVTSWWAYGYDAEKAMEQAWEQSVEDRRDSSP